ncbi:MAG: acyl-CoA transferase, partial [Granulosicoccus sp.]|nr:acyl-CoA transferase [Granulosicoccus sp.]
MRRAVWNASGAAQVERMPATRWCSHSVYPIGWELPSSWDAFAGDYCAEDGWIRLHTNAAHHRQAALQVLGQPTDQRELQHRVSRWQASELEAAVVAAGGAAARMMSCNQWQDHVQGRAVNTEPIIAWQQRGRVESGDDLLRFATPQRPLQGVRVLDLTRVLAGPVSTRFLAALGADVLRIDPPDWQEEGNTLEMTLGKRCAGLDLRRPDDRACFETLLASAHVLVHGYRRDALAGLGFDEVARLRANPDLIDVALNAYGWSGPWSKRRGFDSLV